ncbi:BhlA/UviB family holin-like peptide [Senegalia massiliensis]|uniref:BhlA/UviB family holin-like peptide n=1 Tax=Senegalia massiliensis TaxID=1720316 RepID=UPI00136209DC
MENFILETAAASGLWALLAVALLLYTIKSSEKRENRLMKHLDKTNESHEKIAHSMEKLEDRMENGFNKVWDKINNL